MMRKIIIVFLILILIALAGQFYQLYLQYHYLKNEYSIVDEKWNFLKNENAGLRADLIYFSEPENLEKELRSKFNYKKSGEKLIIVVPPKNE